MQTRSIRGLSNGLSAIGVLDLYLAGYWQTELLDNGSGQHEVRGPGIDDSLYDDATHFVGSEDAKTHGGQIVAVCYLDIRQKPPHFRVSNRPHWVRLAS
jgi:hypothetical protein